MTLKEWEQKYMSGLTPKEMNEWLLCKDTYKILQEQKTGMCIEKEVRSRGMTKEEAIGHLRVIITYAENDGYTELAIEALKMAIKVLEQQPILDKIKAEIEAIAINGQVDEHIAFIRTGEQVKKIALDIIDKYKAEVEEGIEE